MMLVVLTSSGVSEPSDLIRTRNDPKSPNSTIFPLAISRGMILSSPSHTASISKLLTVEMIVCRASG